jgi:hypothetical protein
MMYDWLLQLVWALDRYGWASVFRALVLIGLQS